VSFKRRMQRQRPEGRVGTRVEVTPGSFSRISRLTRTEMLAADQLLTKKRGVQGECMTLMRDIKTRLAPTDPIPDWVSSFSRRVMSPAPTELRTLAELTQLHNDLVRWLDELKQAAWQPTHQVVSPPSLAVGRWRCMLRECGRDLEDAVAAGVTVAHRCLRPREP